MVLSQKPATAATPPATPSAPAHPPSPPAWQPSATTPQPLEHEIRAYANHLFVQGGSLSGHDHDNWLEAEACLRANIPMESSRTRMHHHTQLTERARLPLIKHGRS